MSVSKLPLIYGQLKIEFKSFLSLTLSSEVKSVIHKQKKLTQDWPEITLYDILKNLMVIDFITLLVALKFLNQLMESYLTMVITMVVQNSGMFLKKNVSLFLLF